MRSTTAVPTHPVSPSDAGGDAGGRGSGEVAGRGSRIAALVSVSEVRWAAVATLLFLVGAAAHLLGAPAMVWWTLYLVCYVTGGWEPALVGLRALREKTLDVDILMIVAALLAASIGQVFDGALLIVIFATSGALEAFVTHRTADSVRALLTLAPERATRLTSTGVNSGTATLSRIDVVEEVVDTAQLRIGDVVLVRPGERVAADGVVLDGLSEVDQASITGEPLPIVKGKGDEVFAGTINGTGALQVRVAREAGDSVVARIVALVAEASRSKAGTQLFIERIEQRYSIGVVAATLALFTIPLALGNAFEPTLLRAMTFMIVASPCAVVLATMPPLLATIANAGRHGVLVKSAIALEAFGAIDVVVFDKTGTLTQGTPEVAAIHPLDASGLSPGELLALAAAAEQPSEHPIGRAVVTAAHKDRTGDAKGGTATVPDCEQFSSTPGLGVTATVHGVQVRVGSPALLAATVSADHAAADLVARLEHRGHTAVVVLLDGEAAGVLGLADLVRPGAQETVAALTRVTGRTPILLTGDNAAAARRLAGQVGITDVRASLLPDDKVAHIRDLQAAGHRVALVGDGVNDAPAMAAAELGIAMGRSASDLTLETADAVMVRDELAALPRLINLSRRAHRVVQANVAFAATVITTLVICDIAWTLPLPLGVAGHEGSTIVVALNGLRLLRKSAWNQASRPRS